MAAAQEAPKGQEPPKISEEARQNFEAGVALLQDPAKPRYEEAYRRFQAAYALSGVPRILGNLALCAMKLERDAEAIAAYERYLKEVPDIEPAERTQIERDLLTLKTGLTKITVSAVPAGATILDTRITTAGDDITNAYGPLNGPLELALRPGHHIIKARLAGRVEGVHEFDATGGTLPPKQFNLALPPSSASAPLAAYRPVPISVPIGSALTGALAAGALVTGLLAVKNGSDFDAANTGRTPERAEDVRGRTQTLNLATDVLIASAVVAAGVTTYLFLSRPERVRPGVQGQFTGGSFRF